MGPEIGLYIVGGVILLLIIGGILTGISNSKRSQKLEALANQLGFQYFSNHPPEQVNQLNTFELMTRGRARLFSNSLTRENDGVQVAIFDYRYTTGSGKNSHTHHQTVVSMRSEDLRLPFFTMSPENVMHRIASAFGYQDINFAEAPVFSKMFLLRGSEEASIREFMNVERLHRLEAFRGIHLEARGDRFLCWYTGGRRKPEEVEKLLQTAFEILVILRG
ncbi:MAG: hypothetical protein JNL58_02070 [Planctomyces sp.]|nr:hypothetical protein [Planctomyces sp.]